MKPAKLHIEMATLDLTAGWEQLAGFPAGLEVRMLSDDFDETAKTGARTRLVRFAPGARTTHVLVHDYCEEVFVLSGDLAPPDTDAPVPSAPTYSYRPPGTPHGPFVSRTGCVLFETQYYVKG